MPNWCTNKIVIYARLKTIREFLSNPDIERDAYEAMFNFDIASLYRHYLQGQLPYTWNAIPKEWELEFDGRRDLDEFDSSYDDRVFDYEIHYTSAWTPPINELREFVCKYKCAVSLCYEEPYRGLEGFFECHFDPIKNAVVADNDVRYPQRMDYSNVDFPG
jgi:hypothetical protein